MAPKQFPMAVFSDAQVHVHTTLRQLIFIAHARVNALSSLPCIKIKCKVPSLAMITVPFESPSLHANRPNLKPQQWFCDGTSAGGKSR